jgi:hypothetical protein
MNTESSEFQSEMKDRKTFYGGDVAGYTDYPAHDELAQV